MTTERATSADDARYLALALRLGRRGWGRTAPNPAVGCVLVRAGRIVGRGWTQPGGRPHAESEALRRAGAEARGATAYVSLEPCAHVGRTPPCADALIDAGIARLVCAIEDPDPRVSGAGFARLRDAGIAVDAGLLADAARDDQAGFLSSRERGRPLVALKLATSLDGRIATAAGHSRWITGPSARRHGHLLRATHDAIMVGSGTALADNPRLDCRLPGLAGRSPRRVLIDGGRRLPGDALLAQNGSGGAGALWRYSRADAPGADLAGVRETRLPARDGRIDLAAVLADLAGQGITRLLVEGGGGLAAALLRDRLVDRLYWYRAPVVLGGDGRPAVEALGLTYPDEAAGWRRLAVQPLGADLLETFTAAA